VSEQLIAKMTDTLCEVVGEVVREHTWVIVEGHDPSNWGTGGKPLRVPDMPS